MYNTIILASRLLVPTYSRSGWALGVKNMDFKCQECGKIYQGSPYRAKTTKHCSRTCHNRAVGRVSSKPWAHKISKSHLGMKKPWATKRNLENNPAKVGIESSQWKGEDVGYIAMHNWVRRHVGIQEACEICGASEKLELSNKSNQYKRNASDWWTLCISCHRAYDASFRKNGGVSRKLHRWEKKKPTT